MEWITSPAYVDYDAAEAFMDARIMGIQQQKLSECVWLLEHSPLYTAGTSAQASDYLKTHDLPVYSIGRGGKYTYHGPGQRVCYVMLDLSKRTRDVKKHVWSLEQWGIEALHLCGVTACRDEAGVGLWVSTEKGSSKIAAIGVRVSKWVTKYGIAFNLAPNLEYYNGIIPCGIEGKGVTSLKALGIDVTMDTFDAYLKQTFARSFA